MNGGRKKEKRREREKKSMIIVVPSCLKDADGARTRSDQNSVQLSLCSAWLELSISIETE